MRDGKDKVAYLCDHLNGWGPSNLDKIWAKCVMSSREEGKNGEEREKREEQSELDEGFVCRMTFSTNSWHEPVLKVLDGPQSNNILPPLSLVLICGTNRC